MRYISDTHTLAPGDRIIVYWIPDQTISFGIIRLITDHGRVATIYVTHGLHVDANGGITQSSCLTSLAEMFVPNGYNQGVYRTYVVDSWKDVLDVVPVAMAIQYPGFLKAIYSTFVNQGMQE